MMDSLLYEFKRYVKYETQSVFGDASFEGLVGLPHSSVVERAVVLNMLANKENYLQALCSEVTYISSYAHRLDSLLNNKRTKDPCVRNLSTSILSDLELKYPVSSLHKSSIGYSKVFLKFKIRRYLKQFSVWYLKEKVKNNYPEFRNLNRRLPR